MSAVLATANAALAVNALINGIIQLSAVAAKLQQAQAEGRDLTEAEVIDARGGAIAAIAVLSAPWKVPAAVSIPTIL